MKDDLAEIMKVWIATGKIGNYTKKVDIRKASSKLYDNTTSIGNKSNSSVRHGVSSNHSVKA